MSTPIQLASLDQSIYGYGEVQNQGDLWGRAAVLTVASRGASVEVVQDVVHPEKGTVTYATTTSKGRQFDLDNFHFVFHVALNDIATYNSMTCRIYNLDQSTMMTLIREYDQVTLEAGYQNNVNYGMIFAGNITMYRKGKEAATDNFLEIQAFSHDVHQTFGFINTTLGSEDQASTWNDIYDACAAKLGLKADAQSKDYIANSGAVLLRPRTLYGMATEPMDELAATLNAHWSEQNGVLIVQPIAGVRKGSYIDLSPDSGLVGIPVATEQGVEARCLLNAKLKMPAQVQIRRDLITETYAINYSTLQQVGFTEYTSQYNQYRVVQADYYGDTRGQDWYTDIVAQALGTADDLYTRALRSAGGST